MADDPALDQSTQSNLGPKCPYCGETSQAEDQSYYTDDRVRHTCGWCENDYDFTYHRTDSWRAVPVHDDQSHG